MAFMAARPLIRHGIYYGRLGPRVDACHGVTDT